MFNLARIISFEDLKSEDALNHSIAILMVGLSLLALAGRKYIRDRDLNLPRISDLKSRGGEKKASPIKSSNGQSVSELVHQSH
jgi:hypothetical protein